MKCSLLTLSCALDGELSRDRQLELDAHLITCDRCKTGMRYLREETERVSLLAPVRLTSSTTTALLERSRVLVSAPDHAPEEPLDSATEPGEEQLPDPMPSAPDPFGALGISAAILDSPAVQEPPDNIPSDQEDEAPDDQSNSSDLEGTDPELAHGSAFEASEADRSASDALAAVPEELWLADTSDDPEPDPTADPFLPTQGETQPFPEQEATTVDGSPPPVAPAVSPADEEAPAESIGESMVALDLPPLPYESPSTTDEQAADDSRPSSMVVPGWEPATELKVPWEDIPAATPASEAWSPEVAGLAGITGLPVARPSPLPPAAPFPAAPPPTRPAVAAVPGLQADRKSSVLDRQPPRRSVGSGFRLPVPPRSGKGGPEPRSWPRTGLVAVAALAVVLILWNITHGSKPAGVHHSNRQTTAAASATPSPSTSPSPTPTATPLVLTGTQSVGSSGSGYSVQTVQYGVHGSQFWVVFHFVGGSGQPAITSGFDGPQTIYLEMQGVAPGTQVTQPATGNLVSSVSIGHVAGFSGAVYVLHLSRAAQISPSQLIGSEAGAPGYLAIIQ